MSINIIAFLIGALVGHLLVKWYYYNKKKGEK